MLKILSITKFRPLVMLGMTLALATQASADVTFSFSQGDLAAEATFAKDGTNLLVTLLNTTSADVEVPEGVLTGVFFDLPDSVTLTPVRADLTAGSTVLFPLSGDGHDNGEVGGEYGFVDDLTTVPSGARMVIAAAGLDDTVGDHDVFPGPHWTHNPPNGLGYGIVGSDEDPYNGNTPVTGKVPLVKSGVVFTLSGLPENFDLDSNVSAVMWNYGTEFNPVPAPGAALLGMIGLGMVALVRKRRLG